MRRAALLIAVIVGIASGAPASAQAICPTFRWVTLGTAGGPVPTPERSEPANLLVAGDRHILVDTGDGTVGQLARMGLTIGSVNSVLISHLHLDHSGGLAAVIGLRWMNQFPGVLTVYGPPGTKAVVDGIIASMAPPAKIGFGLGVAPPGPAAGVTVVEIADGARVVIGDVAVRAVANSHFDPGGGPAAAVSLSYRFDFAGRAITYSGDTGPSAAFEQLAASSDMLVSEVIALDPLIAEIKTRRADASPQMLAQMREHLATHHLPPGEIGRIAAKARVGHVVMTHFAVPPGSLASVGDQLRTAARQHFAGPIDLASDLASFDVGCSR